MNQIGLIDLSKLWRNCIDSIWWFWIELNLISLVHVSSRLLWIDLISRCSFVNSVEFCAIFCSFELNLVVVFFSPFLFYLSFYKKSIRNVGFLNFYLWIDFWGKKSEAKTRPITRLNELELYFINYLSQILHLHL